MSSAGAHADALRWFAGSLSARRLMSLAAAGFWILAGTLLLYRLGDFPLKDYDEAVYAEVAREIIRTGDFLTLRFNHEPYLYKPPLYFWLSHLVIRVLGFSEFSSRLPGVLFGALTLWATVRLGRALGGPLCGLAAGTLLLTTAMFLENASRHASADSLLLFLAVAALWAQWRARRVPALRYLPVALLGLAVLTKGAAALPLLVVLALLHWLLGDYRVWAPGAYGRAMLLLGAIVVPWYALQTALHGTEFWYKHVHFMVWQRLTQTGYLHSRGSLYYTKFLLEQLTHLWPLGLLLLWMGLEGRVWRRVRDVPDFLRRRGEIGLTLLVAIAVPLVLFSAAKNHTWWYILPTVPPLCVLGGLVFATAGRWLWPLSLWRRGLFSALVVLLLVNGHRARGRCAGRPDPERHRRVRAPGGPGQEGARPRGGPGHGRSAGLLPPPLPLDRRLRPLSGGVRSRLREEADARPRRGESPGRHVRAGRCPGHRSPPRAGAPHDPRGGTRVGPRRRRRPILIPCSGCAIAWPRAAGNRGRARGPGVTFASLAEARAAGYRPCNVCRPAA